MATDNVRRGPRHHNGAIVYPRPAGSPNTHHGPSIVRDLAALWRCSETAAKKRLEGWAGITNDLAVVVRPNPVHRDYVGRRIAELVAACCEPTAADHQSLLQAFAAELADTVPVMTRYAAEQTEANANDLRRELREDRGANAELDTALARHHLQVMR